jgi:uncharacterized RDD family membrane protein YckC
MYRYSLRLALALMLGLFETGLALAQDAPAAPDAPPPSVLERPSGETPDPPPANDPPSRRRTSRESLGDLVAIGDDVVVKEGETARSVVVIAGSALIEGTVTGDLVVVLGKVTLGSNAVVRRDLVVVGGSLEDDPAAKIRRDRVVIGGVDTFAQGLGWLQWPSQWFNAGLLYARPLPHQYAWSWTIAAIALLLYITISVLFPRQVQAAVVALEERPGNSMLTGLLAFVLMGPLLLLLVITVVGIIIVPFVLCGLVVAFLFGKVAVYRFAGQQVGSQLGWAGLRQPLLALVIGAILFYLLYTVPVLGLLAWVAVAPLGLGAVLLAMFKRSEVRDNGGQAGTPAGSDPVEVILPSPGDISASATLLPRVGFWLRVLATLLDFALVGLVVAGIFHQARWFLLSWVIYHLALWSWRGTTVGGIILGLKIVRTDGRPINFAVALVRLLGSFFSAGVLGLGFFWAGWSRDKQSWHDIIAGTVVVKFPRTTPLL